MDPRERADAVLARARAKGAYVVTPDDAVSPMDASSTVQIPRAVVNAVDNTDGNDTMVIPAATARGHVPPQQPGPATPPQGFPQPGRRRQTGPHQPGHNSGQHPPVPQPGHNSGQYPPVWQPGHNSGQHPPVPQPGHNSGPYQPVPPPMPQPMPQAPQAWTDEQADEARQLDGLVPTTQHTQRSSLSRRLDGQ